MTLLATSRVALGLLAAGTGLEAGKTHARLLEHLRLLATRAVKHVGRLRRFSRDADRRLAVTQTQIHVQAAKIAWLEDNSDGLHTSTKVRRQFLIMVSDQLAFAVQTMQNCPVRDITRGVGRRIVRC